MRPVAAPAPPLSRGLGVPDVSPFSTKDEKALGGRLAIPLLHPLAFEPIILRASMALYMSWLQPAPLSPIVCWCPLETCFAYNGRSSRGSQLLSKSSWSFADPENDSRTRGSLLYSRENNLWRRFQALGGVCHCSRPYGDFRLQVPSMDNLSVILKLYFILQYNTFRFAC